MCMYTYIHIYIYIYIYIYIFGNSFHNVKVTLVILISKCWQAWQTQEVGMERQLGWLSLLSCTGEPTEIDLQRNSTPKRLWSCWDERELKIIDNPVTKDPKKVPGKVANPGSNSSSWQLIGCGLVKTNAIYICIKLYVYVYSNIVYWYSGHKVWPKQQQSCFWAENSSWGVRI